MGKINEHDQIVKAKRTLHAAPTCQEYGFEPAPARHFATDEEIRSISQEILQGAGGLSAVEKFEISGASAENKRLKIKRWINAPANQERLESLKKNPLIDKILVSTKNNDIVISMKEPGDVTKVCNILSGKLEGYQEALREAEARNKAAEESRSREEQAAKEKAAKEAAMKERLKREAQERERQRQEQQKKAAEEAARRKAAEEAARKKAAEEEARRKAAAQQSANVPLSICSPGQKVRPAEVDGLVKEIISRAGGKSNIKGVGHSDRNLLLTLKTPLSNTKFPGWTHLAVAHVKEVSTTVQKANNTQKDYKVNICLNNGEAAYLAYGKLCKGAGQITGAQTGWSYLIGFLFAFLAYRMNRSVPAALAGCIIPGIALSFCVMILMFATHKTSLTAAIMATFLGLVQRNIAGVPMTADLIGTAVGAFFGFWIVFAIIEAIIIAIARGSARKK